MKFAKMFFVIFLFVLCYSQNAMAQLYINELMADNENALPDERNEYDDWVEIYNASGEAIQLKSYYLTDDKLEPQKWAFPEMILPAGGFLLVWTDKDPEQGDLHATLKLAKEGEFVGIFDGASFIDSLTFPAQTEDMSYGRYPDGSESWYFYQYFSAAGPNFFPEPQKSANPDFSPTRGFFSRPVHVQITTANSGARIHYTMDGSNPTESSALYTGPIYVDETTVVRACNFEAGNHASDIISHSYIIDDNFEIATLSMITDPDNLWDNQTGIYRNPSERGRDWERPAFIEFFEDNDQLAFAENVGVRIHGGVSRSLHKKSFRFYFRSEYGQSWLNYQLFEEKDLDKFKRIIINGSFQDSPSRSEYDSGTLIRDPMLHTIGRTVNEDMALGTRPVAVYINGEPWGIYNMIERIDNDFLETNFGIEDGDIIDNYYFVKEGSKVRWEQMMAFIQNHDLSDPVNYERAKQYIDINNFTHYYVVEIWAGNVDWPGNNNIAYLGDNADDQWKWLLWDMDKSFVYRTANSLKKATDEEGDGTIILRKFLENDEYKNYFINQFADHFNTKLRPEVIIPVINAKAALIRNDVDFEINRWGGSQTEWEDHIDFLCFYASERIPALKNYFVHQFSLGGLSTITLNAPQGNGFVRINSLQFDQFPWSGEYFHRVPIEIEAIPEPGYHFVGWSDPNVPAQRIITVTIDRDYAIHPIFAAGTLSYDVVINEINYNSAPDFNPEDWIELYNFSGSELDVSGWHLKDENDANDFVFPAQTIIPALGYLVICKDGTAFSGLHPEVTNYVGDFEFGFSGGGELISLFDEVGVLVDSVRYDDDAPWPVEADGAGATLALIDHTMDNGLPESWQAGSDHGTPGRTNIRPTSPIILATPSSLSFNGVKGSLAPADQSILITDIGSGTLSWQAEEKTEQSWLALSSLSGISGESITITIDTTGLSAGHYDGVVLISDPLALNNPVEVAIDLEFSAQPTGPELGQFEAEASISLPNAGWQETINDGESCLEALVSDISSPPAAYRLDYSFMVPDDVSEVYVFAEVDVNGSSSDDSYWVQMNGGDQCVWNGLYRLGDGWARSWVYDYGHGQQHVFSVQPGLNTLSLFPREKRNFINWLVVTTDKETDLATFEFNSAPPSNDPMLALSAEQLDFSYVKGEELVTQQQLTITNGGGGTLNWSVTESPDQSWLSLDKLTGVAGEQLTVTVDSTGLAVDSYNCDLVISATGAGNSPQTVAVTLVVSEPVSGPELARLEAEGSASLPNIGWEATTNDGENCLKVLVSDISAPPEPYRLDYSFTVPVGVDQVYIFAEVDLNGSGRDDSFWLEVNGSNRCTWNGLYKLGDGWARSWVYDYGHDQQHQFDVQPGVNTLSLYPREQRGFINWLVVTTDGATDIDNFEFGGTPPPPPSTDPILTVSPTNLSFSAATGGSDPAAQSLTIGNSGGGTLNWAAAELTDQSWLSLSANSGTGNGQISVAVDIDGFTEGSYRDTIRVTAAGAANSPQDVVVTLTVTAEVNGPVCAELEAEASPSLPNDGWSVIVNDNESCLLAQESDITGPPDAYRLDYTFAVPVGVSTVYLFAEVDVNKSSSDDSFWIQVNDGRACCWNGLSKLGDGWARSWIYDYGQDQQHGFAVQAGQNTLSVFPREKRAHLNWLVITTDDGTDIDGYIFGGTTPPPPPPSDDPLLAVAQSNLTFTALLGGSNPSAQQLTISNSGAGELHWTVTEQPDQSWLNLNNSSGGDGDQLTVAVDMSGLTVGSYNGTIQIADANASNSPLEVTVTLNIGAEPDGAILAEFRADSSLSLPNPGWEIRVNDGDTCLYALENSLDGPDEQYQLDYVFMVPVDVDEVYVFAEVDVDKAYNSDSFWWTMNGAGVCNWNNLKSLGADWARSWVYDLGQDQQHAFSVSSGENTLSLYPREDKAYINWLVLTTDPDYDIEIHEFGSSLAKQQFAEDIHHEHVDEIPLPSAFKLHQNYPNPFNPITTIGFELAEMAQIRLAVYNMLGQQLAVLIQGTVDAGIYQVPWNGLDSDGQALTTGIYIYRLEIETVGESTRVECYSKKMILSK